MRNIKIKTHILFLIVALSMWISPGLIAQGNDSYTNHWIKKGQIYVKFDIVANGLYKIPFSALPSNFNVQDPKKIQLFYRGKQVSIISTDGNEILFYGNGNDGSTDSLLYRPMSSRINPYTSLFSDKARYFLTIGESDGLRSKQQVLNGSENSSNTLYHFEEEVKVYDKEYSLSTSISIYPSFMNSFYEKGASKTGQRLESDTLIISEVQLNHVDRNSGISPKLELLFHGRSNNSRQIEIYVGKDPNSLRKLKTIDILAFEYSLTSNEIGFNDIEEDGRVFVGYKSLSQERLERYSISYLKINYTQNLDMNAKKSKILNFRPNPGQLLAVSMSGIQSSAAAYDITNVHHPVIVKGSVSNSFTYKSDGSNPKKLYLSSEVGMLTAAQISPVSFSEINPKLYNYIIISADPLKDAASKYGAYRSSAEGGGYSVFYISIKDIYNQFNYGEVSPLGIRAFVDYMLSDGNRDKQLFIIGRSVSLFEKKVADLEGDVPTVGYPGSDMLLVAGLGGVKADELSIPVGRISVTLESQVADYLAKIKQYEHDSNGDQGWKKTVLHVNGGHSAGEITGFKNNFEKFAQYITNGTFGGKVVPFVKKSFEPVEELDITPEVNEGVGMISYMGHGSLYITDLNFGFASAVSKGYRNAGKYPLLYFNGCGVGNIFNGRSNTNLNAGDKIPLSLDWVLSKDKGAIAVIANSFESYTSPSVKYLDHLYKNLFNDQEQEILSIGKIQQNTVAELLNSGVNTYDIGNIHQSVLQGDPAVKLIRVAKPDYAMNSNNAITIFADKNATNIDKSDSLQLQIILKNGGRYTQGQSIPVVIQELLDEKVVNSISRLIPSYRLQDTLLIRVPNLGRKINQFKVLIDPENKIAELNKTNNFSKLDIDWTIAGVETIYPLVNLVDIYPPQIEVNFNNHFIESGQFVSKNPQINLQVSDDRAMEADLGLVEIFIKNCEDESCDYVQIQDNLSIIKKSEKSFTIQYTPTNIDEGVYEMLVNVKDPSGNMQLSPYRVLFKVKDTKEIDSGVVSFIVSPNPTSSYVKFNIQSGLATSNNVVIEVYNIVGNLIYAKHIAHSMDGIYDWYWTPNVPSGTYVYKIRVKNDDQELKLISGRVVIVK